MSDRPLTPERLEQIHKRSRFLSNPEAFELSMLCREVDRLTEENRRLWAENTDLISSPWERAAKSSWRDIGELIWRIDDIDTELDEERAGREQAEQLAELILDRFDLALDELDPTGDIRGEYQVLNDRDRETLGRGNQG